MHILFFSHYFTPEGNAPASRTFENCKRWVRRGHRVTVITCAPNVPNGIVYEGYKNKIYQREHIEGIDVIRVWTYIAANKGTLLRIINYISYMFSSIFFSLFVTKPDIIIATSPQFFCGWAGVISSRLRRVPFILEVRDIWPESIVAVGAMRNKRILRILEWLEIKMYAAAKHIVTVGLGYKQKLIEKGINPEIISIITNGFDSEIFYPRQLDEKFRQLYKPNQEFVCSYVGTIGMACALDVVLRAAKLLKNREKYNIKFLLVGDGAVKKQLQQEAIDNNLDNIVFVDRQDKHLIPGLLSITDVCLVHLKKADLFKTVLPSKIFEAAAMAEPIILGVEGYAAQFLKEANAGICIEPENAEQLARVVENLAGDSNLCKSLGQSGYEYVKKHHNRDTLANEYLNTITRFCGRANKRVMAS
ncbi:MAG: glycosyltransferase family 4 protein [Sedimentisphaerales bacterium]|nr:glycosyltransferase family 4 protein [Sedimentisphaerales bacterium]